VLPGWAKQTTKFMKIYDVIIVRHQGYIPTHSAIHIACLAYTGLRSMNALNINFFLLPTKFLQPVNLAILTI